MTDAQHESDVGDHIRELGQSDAYVAYVQARKEIEAELNARLAAAPRAEQNDLRWILSVEWAEWMKANQVPYTYRTPVEYKPLTLVGRGNNRSGPMSDG